MPASCQNLLNNKLNIYYSKERLISIGRQNIFSRVLICKYKIFLLYTHGTVFNILELLIFELKILYLPYFKYYQYEQEL